MNSNGIVISFATRSCVYVTDWIFLRDKYRIVGQLIGHNGKNEVLPLLLSPEETNLLIKKQICTISTYDYKSDSTSQKLFKNYIGKIYEEEKNVLKEERKKEICEVIGKIIKGKKTKKKTDTSEDDIMAKEMSKLEELKKKNMITATQTTHLDFLKNGGQDISIEQLLTSTTPIRCAVYEDLWNRGYYVTSGHKFGGDFLVYLADPIISHAIYIVKCVENTDEEIPAVQIIMYGRLGNSVKKSFILASCSDLTIKYMSLSWMEISLNISNK